MNRQISTSIPWILCTTEASIAHALLHHYPPHVIVALTGIDSISQCSGLDTCTYVNITKAGQGETRRSRSITNIIRLHSTTTTRVDPNVCHQAHKKNTKERSLLHNYGGADKSLARPGRKQANVSVRMAWISFRSLPCRGEKSLDDSFVSMLLKSRASLICLRASFFFLVGLRTYQHHG